MDEYMEELQHTKLPRHHRDAEDAMRWAAEEIVRLRAVVADYEAAYGGTAITAKKKA